MKGRAPDTGLSGTRPPAAVPTSAQAEPAGDATPLPPALPPDIPQRYLPIRVPRESAEATVLRSRPGKVQGSSILYEPAVFAAGRIHYTSPKMERDGERQFSLLGPFSSGGTIAWESAVQYPGAGMTSYHPLPPMSGSP